MVAGDEAGKVDCVSRFTLRRASDTMPGSVSYWWELGIQKARPLQLQCGDLGKAGGRESSTGMVIQI